MANTKGYKYLYKIVEEAKKQKLLFVRIRSTKLSRHSVTSDDIIAFCNMNKYSCRPAQRYSSSKKLPDWIITFV